MEESTNKRLERQLRYGRPFIICLLACISAFTIVFYATKVPLIYSLSLLHVEIFVTTFLMMLLVILGITGLSKRLDKHLTWDQKPIARTLVQLGLGVVLVAFIALKGVYFAYQKGYGIDLQATDYLQRDFVVVCACIFCVNALHLVFFILIRDEKRKEKFKRLQITVEKAQLELEEKQHHLNQKLDEFMDYEFAIRHKVLGEELWLQANDIAAFFIKPGDGMIRVVYALLRNGEHKILEGVSSLKTAAQPYQYLFIQVCRRYYVNRLFIKKLDLTTIPGKGNLYVEVEDHPPIEISSQMQTRILEIIKSQQQNSDNSR